jgi:hypothetical protein
VPGKVRKLVVRLRARVRVRCWCSMSVLLDFEWNGKKGYGRD